ncbi:hypothetical protein FQA47_010993 [Oryzias melastigma]|uniref:Uncharacterized protein n=1 Tax=Oryzias melastigma TaxID=30732 RepID=A0A834BWB1_ORYME|nr:hypothetical protein FQA47_010993 [Oryzias melastigma]
MLHHSTSFTATHFSQERRTKTGRTVLLNLACINTESGWDEDSRKIPTYPPQSVGFQPQQRKVSVNVPEQGFPSCNLNSNIAPLKENNAYLVSWQTKVYYGRSY